MEPPGPAQRVRPLAGPMAGSGRTRWLHPGYRAATSFAPRKKLTCSDRATSSSFWRCHKHGSGGDRRDLHSIAKFSQALDQAIFLLVAGSAIEVIGAEVLVGRPVLEH